MSISSKNTIEALVCWAFSRIVVGVIVLSVVSANAAEANSTDAPQRIVSLAPHATELLFSAGLGARVVGVSESCDFPDDVKKLPRVSGYRGTNVEAVLALNPDLVVAWPSGNRTEELATLERLGIKVYRSEIDSLAGIANTLRQFANWANDTAEKGRVNARAASIDREIQSLRDKYAARATVRVFYQLGDGRLFTLSNKHMIGEALAACGARNIFGKLKIPAPEVSREAIFAAKPDAILLASANVYDAVAKQWKNSALHSTPIAIVDGHRLHRPTSRTIEAVQAMCEKIDTLRKRQ
jgi:ABC-type Fe3+-hydroxamate transport system substrate-binding protein